MISPSLLKAQGELLKTKVEFSTILVHNNTTYYVLVGSERLYLFSEKFNTIQAEIEYMHIERIIISTCNPELFQMHLSEFRNKNVPAKMNIHTLNRRNLVNNIVYAWKTDFLYTKLEVRDLPTYKKKFKDTKHNPANLLSGSGNFLVLMEPQESQGFLQFIINGYRFWLEKTQEFTPSKELGIYKHSVIDNCYFNIQVSETQPLEVLHLIGDRISLQYYAESFMDQILVQEMADLEDNGGKLAQSPDQVDEENPEDEEDNKDQVEEPEGKIIVDDFWILTSSSYVKRENLNNDPAEWTAWEVSARTQKRDIIVLIMRRKYIPPLMENYNEIVIVFYGPEGKSTLKAVKEQDQEEQKEEEEPVEDEEEDDDDDENEPDDVKVKDNGINLKAAYEQMIKDQEFLILVRDVGDKFQSIYNVDGRYESIMKMNLNALMLDEDTLQFYQERLGFFPRVLTYAVKLMLWFFDTAAAEKISDASVYQTYRKKLLDLYQFEMDENPKIGPIIEKMIDKNSVAEDFVKLFENDYGDLITQSLTGDKKRIWSYKLARYIAYCFNGGLMGTEFTLQHIFLFLDNNGVSSSARISVNRLLDYFLFAAAESSGGSSDFSMNDVTKRIQKLVGQKYDYNELVMNSMLINDFFSQEITVRKEQPQLYTELMIYVLQNSKRAQPKICACKHIIQYQAGHKGQASEAIINTFKPLIDPLMQIYQSKNRVLSTLGCIALFNMCTNSKEFKYLIMKDEGAAILVQKLKSKDSNELTYTLKLIHNLLTVVQHIEKFMNLGIINQMFSLIAGTSIKGAFYSAQTMISACQILKVCLAGDYQFKSLDGCIKLLIKLYLDDSNNYILDETQFQNLQLETLNVIGKICLRNHDCKKQINDSLVPKVLETLIKAKGSSTRERDIIEKLVFFLCIIIQDDKELGVGWKILQPFLMDAISCCEVATIANSNFLMKELTQEEEKVQKK